MRSGFVPVASDSNSRRVIDVIEDRHRISSIAHGELPLIPLPGSSFISVCTIGLTGCESATDTVSVAWRSARYLCVSLVLGLESAVGGEGDSWPRRGSCPRSRCWARRKEM